MDYGVYNETDGVVFYAEFDTSVEGGKKEAEAEDDAASE